MVSGSESSCCGRIRTQNAPFARQILDRDQEDRVGVERVLAQLGEDAQTSVEPRGERLERCAGAEVAHAELDRRVAVGRPFDRLPGLDRSRSATEKLFVANVYAVTRELEVTAPDNEDSG